MNKLQIIAGMLILSCLVFSSPARGTPLVGCTYDGMLYDIDPLTGAASNSRDTGITDIAGIAYSPGGVLYGMTTWGSDWPPPYPNQLYTIDQVSGEATLVAPLGGVSVSEGDLAFHPATGLLYGLSGDIRGLGFDSLFRIETSTVEAIGIGQIDGNPDSSGMAFDASGTLYVLDTWNELLLTVDTASADVLASIPLSTALGCVAGMDFDPVTGVLYVADGGTDEHPGTDSLYVLDTDTGGLTLVGPTGVEYGFSALAFIPEPTSLSVLLWGSLLLGWRKRNRKLQAWEC